MSNAEFKKEIQTIIQEAALIQQRATGVLAKLAQEEDVSTSANQSALSQEQILLLRKQSHDRMFKQKTA